MKSRKNLTRFTYETTAFQGWRLCISRGGKTFTRYFSDKQHGGERKALKAAEARLSEMKQLLDQAPRRDGKLTKTAEARAGSCSRAPDHHGGHHPLRSERLHFVGHVVADAGQAPTLGGEPGC